MAWHGIRMLLAAGVAGGRAAATNIQEVNFFFIASFVFSPVAVAY